MFNIYWHHNILLRTTIRDKEQHQQKWDEYDANNYTDSHGNAITWTSQEIAFFEIRTMHVSYVYYLAE